MPTRDQVKQWFRTGDYPTQAQFWAFFDSIFFKDEAMGAPPDVSALQLQLQTVINRMFPQVVINSAAQLAFTLPAGLLLEMVALQATADCVISVGFSAGAQDLVPPLDQKGGQWNVLQLDYFAEVDTTLYFNNISQISQFKFYKR